MKIAIVKADDMRFNGPYKKWDKFFETAEKRNLKVSVGMIGYSESTSDRRQYYKYLRETSQKNTIEYWNHGWYHVLYSGDDALKQKENIEKAQILSSEIFGRPFTTFGFPGNGYNEASAEALNAISEIKAVFIRPMPEKSFLERFNKILIKNGPSVATKETRYNPDSSIFIKNYNNKRYSEDSVMSVEFHPAAHDDRGTEETGQIFDFLLDKGWTFILPSEYISKIENSH